MTEMKVGHQQRAHLPQNIFPVARYFTSAMTCNDDFECSKNTFPSSTAGHKLILCIRKSFDDCLKEPRARIWLC